MPLVQLIDGGKLIREKNIVSTSLDLFPRLNFAILILSAANAGGQKQDVYEKENCPFSPPDFFVC
jgi:hypothetical protein